MISGDLPHRIKRLHDEYGPIIRVAPNELSFTDPVAWRDIYPKNSARPSEFKNKPPGKNADNLITASEADHTRLRKILAPAFSDKAIHKQEFVVSRHVDLLILKLRQTIDNDLITATTTTVDMLEWLNYTTFDIIGDFVWGSSFDCLKRAQGHPWLQVIAQFKATLFVTALKFYPTLDAMRKMITPKSALADLWMIWRVTEEKISQRLEVESSHPDVISYITAINNCSNLSMSRDEIEINSMALVVAGSESVTTALVGIINYLLREPEKLEKLNREIRTSIHEGEEVTAASLKKLPYLNAVLSEGLRLCPTIPDGMRRLVPKGGAAVAGEMLSEGTVVSIPQWACYQSTSNFYKPTEFHPERWLGQTVGGLAVFDKDRKDALNPFSLGAHNCPGRELAYLEMRLILTQLVCNFDMRMSPDRNLVRWAEQKIYWFWEKQPCYVMISKAT